MSPNYCIITGGNAGLGYSLADRLLLLGNYHVTLGCRSVEKGRQAVTNLQAKHAGSGMVDFLQLDLASPSSVRRFAKEYAAKGYPLHLLINNGGIYCGSALETTQVSSGNDDGSPALQVELAFATNYLGHFLLTRLLLPLLASSARVSQAPSRIVDVSSELHSKAPVLDLTNVDFSKGGYGSMSAYGTSKLALLYHTYHLSQLLSFQSTEDGKRLVTINACTPGFVPTTNISKGTVQRMFHRYVLGWLPFARTLEQGVDCMVKCCMKDMDASGKYMQDGKWIPSSEASEDKDKGKELWEWSSRLFGVDGGDLGI